MPLKPKEVVWRLFLPPGYTKLPLPGLKKWVAALRSGRYKQGTGYLRDNEDLYCCLGVLCEVQGIPYDAAERTYATSISALNPSNPRYSDLSAGGAMPEGVFVEVWIEPTGRWGRDRQSLAKLNDAGLTFGAIADILEQIWEEPK